MNKSPAGGSESWERETLTLQAECRAHCDLQGNADINKGFRRTGKEEINVLSIWDVLFEEKRT